MHAQDVVCPKLLARRKWRSVTGSPYRAHVQGLVLCAIATTALDIAVCCPHPLHLLIKLHMGVSGEKAAAVQSLHREDTGAALNAAVATVNSFGDKQLAIGVLAEKLLYAELQGKCAARSSKETPTLVP